MLAKLSLFFFILIFFKNVLYVSAGFTCMYVSALTLCMTDTHGGQKSVGFSSNLVMKDCDPP